MKTLNTTLLNWIMNEKNNTDAYTQYNREEAEAILNFIEEATSKVGTGSCATFNFDGELLNTSLRQTAKMKGINFICYCPDTRIINITLGGVQSLFSTSLVKKF